MTEEFKNCPRCGAPIRSAAVKCRHCGSWLTPEGLRAQPGQQTSAQPSAQAGTAQSPAFTNITDASARLLNNGNVQAVSSKLDALSPKNALLLFAGAGALIILLFLLLPMWSMGPMDISGGKCISMGSEVQSALYPILPIIFVAGVAFAVIWTFIKKTVNWIYAAVSAALGILTLLAVPMIPIGGCGYLVIVLCLAWAALAFLLKGRTLTLD